MIRGILSFLFTKWLHRQRMGTFTILSSARFPPSFRTDFGTFTIDADKSEIAIKGKKRRSIPFDKIVGLDYQRDEESALLLELWMGGWDGKTDAIAWYKIGLQLDDGRVVPIYQVGQYEKRINCEGWLKDKYLQFEAAIGFSRDLSRTTAQVLEAIHNLLADAGQHFPCPRAPAIDSDGNVLPPCLPDSDE